MEVGLDIRELLMFLAVLHAVHAICSRNLTEDGRIPITLGGLIGIHSEDNGWSGAGLVPAMELAIQDINNRTDVLPGYKLQWEYLDSRCNPGLSAALLVSLMSDSPTKLMILGETCSHATVSIAQMSHYFNLMQVTPTSNSPELANRKKFKSLFRPNLVYHKSLYPIAWICRHFGWRHVAVVRQNIGYFTSTAGFLEPYLQEHNVTILASEAVDTRPPVGQVANLKKKDVRIIIYLGYEGAFRHLLCEAYKKKLFGELYQWFTTAYFQSGWLEANDTDCTPQQLREVSELALGTLPMLHDISGDVTISGRTYNEYEELYNRTEKKYAYNSYHTYGYDTVWIAALALNNSIQRVAQQNITEWCDGVPFNRPKGLGDFTYSDIYMAEIFKEELGNLDFPGVTGRIAFNKDGGRIATGTQIVQLQESKFVTVGYYISDSQKVVFNGSHRLLWKGSGPPVDVVQTKIVKVYLDQLYLIITSILGGLGSAFAVSFLTFNTVYRNRRCIKLSSPRLNSVIAVGCMTAYCAIVCCVLDGRVLSQRVLPYIMCSTFTVLLMVSFTLTFGAMLAKTWRVYSIFKEKTSVSNKPMHDHHLLAFVMCLLLVDAVVFTSWTISDPPYMIYTNGTRTESSQCAYQMQTETCSSTYSLYWSVAILVEKGLFLAGGCFLAFETRNVHIPELNDSRFIGICVYNTIVMSLVGLAVNLVMNDERDIATGFTVGSVFITATLSLTLLFLPKIRDIRKEVGCPSESNASARSSTFGHSMENVDRQLEHYNRNLSTLSKNPVHRSMPIMREEGEIRLNPCTLVSDKNGGSLPQLSDRSRFSGSDDLVRLRHAQHESNDLVILSIERKDSGRGSLSDANTRPTSATGPHLRKQVSKEELVRTAVALGDITKL